MGYARYVGRVGALAMTLGIGVAIANGPGVAWADGDEGSSSGSTSGASSGTTGTAGTSSGGTTGEPAGDSGETSPSDPSGAVEEVGEEAEIADEPDSEETAARDEDETGASSEENPSGDEGADPPQPEADLHDDRELTPAVPTGDSRSQTVVAQRSDIKVTSTVSVPSTELSSSPTGGAGPDPVTTTIAVETLAQPSTFRSMATADDQAVAVSEAVPVTQAATEVITGLFSWLGLNPLVDGGPADAPASPFAWAIFAALRRLTEEDTGIEQRPVPLANPVATTLTVENATPVYELDSSIPVGAGPTGLAVTPDGSRVYVADRFTKSVSVIDTSTRTIVATIPMGAGPNAVAISPDGSRAYVGLHGVNRVAVIDTATNTVVNSVKVGPGVTEIAVTPDGSRAYVTNTSGRTVSVIDTATNTEITRVAVGSSPMGLAVTPDGSQVYVANRYSNSVSVIDTATNTVVRTVKVGSSPRSVVIAPDGSRAYVTNAGPDTVSVIDTSTNTVVATVRVGRDPIGVAMSPDGSLVYAANSNDSVSVIDVATNSVVGTFAVDPKPETGVHYMVVGPDGTVYVTDTRDKMVRVVTATSPVAQMSTFSVQEDANAMALLAAAANAAPTVSTQPTGIPNATTGIVSRTIVASDADGNTLSYNVSPTSVNGGTVTINSATGVYTYTPKPAARLAAGATPGADTDTFTVTVSDGQASTTATVPVYVSPLQIGMAAVPSTVGRNPAGIAVHGNKVYVVNHYDKTVAVIDTNATSPTYNQVISTIKLASAPSDIVLNSTGTRAYVTTKGNASVAVINTETNTVITNVRVGSTPTAIAISTDPVNKDKFLYVTNGGSSTVSVVDTATNKEIRRITVGSQPNGIAVSPDGTKLYVTLRYADSLAVVNVADGTKALVKVGDSPRDVALTPDGRTAYVANYDGTVSVVDTVTKAQLAKLVTGGPKLQPVAVAVSAKDGLAYVANADDSLTVIDTKTNTIVLTTTGSGYSGAHAIAVGPDGRIYATDFRDNYLRMSKLIRGNTAPISTGSPTVGAANPDTGAVSGSLRTIDPDGDSLSYTTRSGPSRGTVTYNPATAGYTYTPTLTARQQAGQGGPTSDTFTVRATDGSGAFKDVSVTVPISAVSTVPATVSSINLNSPTGLGFGGNQLYVFSQNTGVVSVVNPTTKQVSETTSVPAPYTEPPVVSPDGKFRYVANNTNWGMTMKVDVIDTATGHVIRSVDVPVCSGCGYGNTLGIEELVISPDGSKVYARHDYATETDTFSAVTMIETTNHTVVGTKDFTEFSDMEFTPNGTLYAAAQRYSYIYRMDASLNQLGTIALTPASTGGNIIWTDALAFNANGTRAYVVVDDWDAPNRSLSVIDTATNTEIAVADARTTALSPDGTRRYTLQSDGKTVVVTNATTNAVVGAFATDQNATSGVRSIAVASNGTVYIADAADNKVYVVTVGTTTA